MKRIRIKEEEQHTNEYTGLTGSAASRMGAAQQVAPRTSKKLDKLLQSPRSLSPWQPPVVTTVACTVHA
jgi:hypothetical protein